MNRRSFMRLLGMAGFALATPTAAGVFAPPLASAPSSAIPVLETIPSGYQRLTDEVMIQWGAADSAGKAVFPVAFTKAFSVFAIGESSEEAVMAFYLSATECRLSEPGALWLAIGSHNEKQIDRRAAP